MQAFTIEPKAYATQVTWSLQPGSPGRLTDTGIYSAPDKITSDQQALVTASWRKVQAGAKVSLVSDRLARDILAAYWLIVLVSLGDILFALWPRTSALTQTRRSLHIVPIQVTLRPDDQQQFHAWLDGTTNPAQAAVTWVPSFGTISNGLYTAPTRPPAPSAIITAQSLTDPRSSAHASVNISTGAQLTLQPQIISLSEGDTVQFNPHLMIAGGPGKNNAAQAAISWTLSPPGVGTVTTNGFYQAPALISQARLVTITASYDNDPGVAAAALVRLAGPDPSYIATMLLQLGLILTLGAIGSLLHAISSFVIYVGNRQFLQSWFLWYFFKPFQGALLALVVYLVVAVGLLKVETSGGLLGAGALAVMVGLFSEQASLKLRDVADALFSSRADKRKDKLDGIGQQLDAAPHILSVTPNSISVGANPAPVLTITGANFVPGCLIRLNGADRPPAATSPAELKLNLKAEDVAKPGTLSLFVVSPNKQSSNEAKLTIA
jgi:hypothetical protein